jgi:hypothetical protein
LLQLYADAIGFPARPERNKLLGDVADDTKACQNPLLLLLQDKATLVCHICVEFDDWSSVGCLRPKFVDVSCYYSLIPLTQEQLSRKKMFPNIGIGTKQSGASHITRWVCSNNSSQHEANKIGNFQLYVHERDHKIKSNWRFNQKLYN